MNKLFEDRSGYWLGRLLSIWNMLAAAIILVVMIALPLLAADLTARGQEAISSASEQAAGVAQILSDAEIALLDASVALDTSASALDEVRNSIDAMGPLLGSIQELLGTQAPDAINSTQQGLESAQSGARAMDQMLRVLASLRFLTGVSYAPDQPLDESLQSVSESLVPMPAALISVSDEIETFGRTLDDVEPEVAAAIDDVGSMAVSLRRMSSSISASADAVESLADELQLQAQRFERRAWFGVIIAEVFLLNTALLQLAGAYAGAMLVREDQ